MRTYLVALAFLAASACFAQEFEPAETLKYNMDEYIIVGTRSVEKIIDIPYSVFRVDKKELAFGKKISAKDVLADVPGLFLQSRYGTHDLRISIRGFGTRSNSGVRGVRILQDGIPESEPDGETVIDAVDLSSLGGVEVVKGNLSSLYANAPGGVINFVSDLYFPESYVASTNQFGRFGYHQNGFRTGIKTDVSRFLLSYNYRNIDGFRGHSSEYQHLVNSVYEGFLSDGGSVAVLGNYADGLLRVPGSLTGAEFDADPFQPNPFAAAQDYRRISKKGRLAIRYRNSFGEGKANEYEITGYGGIKELEKADDQYYTIATRYSLGALLHLSNRSHLGPLPNVLTVGMDYAFQSGPVSEYENLYGDRGISVQNQYTGSLGNLGLYLLDHLTLVPDRFDLFASGRFDVHHFSRDMFIPYGLRDASRKFQALTPKVGLNYKLTPVIALYTSFGLGYDFPALSELANSPLSSNTSLSLNPDIEAQKSKNFEAGVKGNIINMESETMRKLFFEVTFFRYVVDKEIIPFVINQKTFFRNAGTTNRTGIEVGVKSEPLEGIELVTNYTFTHFRYDEYTAVVYTPSGSTVETYTGNTVPSVPQHILNFILNYEFEISDEFSGLLQWDCDYISRMYVDDANSESSPAFFYGNIMAGVNVSLGGLNAIAFAGTSNIFDRRYAGFVSINDYLRRYYETGEPRNVFAGVNLSYRL